MSSKTTATKAAPKAAAAKPKVAKKPKVEKKDRKPSSRKGVTIKDVASRYFIKAYAAYLKRTGKVVVPKWANIVKTGILKELAPYNPDWFFVRMAAIARRIYLHPGHGIGMFARIFGGNHTSGSRPNHFQTASGSVIRHALKQLTALKVIEADPKGGRRITATGRRDLDRVSGKVHLIKNPAVVVKAI